MAHKSEHLLSQRLRNVPETLETETRKRAAGPSVVGRHLRSVATSINKRFGFATGYIVENWREIVGPEFADHVFPERLSSSKSGTNVLRIRVPGPLAVQVQHHIPEILSRINRHYGYDAVTDIKIVQAPLPRSAPEGGSLWSTPAATPQPPGGQSSSPVSDVKNPQLRKHLERIRQHLSEK